MPNVSASIKAGVTLTPNSGAAAKHTYTDYKLFLVAPTYATRKRKDVMVSIPYMDGVLDFSDQHQNRVFFEPVEVTYRFVRQFEYGAAGATAMKNFHDTLESFVWGFKGTVADDYRGAVCYDARATSFTATPNPGDNTLEVEVVFQGTPSLVI